VTLTACASVPPMSLEGAYRGAPSCRDLPQAPRHLADALCFGVAYRRPLTAPAADVGLLSRVEGVLLP